MQKSDFLFAIYLIISYLADKNLNNAVYDNSVRGMTQWNLQTYSCVCAHSVGCGMQNAHTDSLAIVNESTRLGSALLIPDSGPRA